MKPKYRCKHCAADLSVIGRRVGGRVVASPSQRHWNRVVQHLKSAHPDIAAQYPGFTHAQGFAVEDHTVSAQAGEEDSCSPD